MRPASKNTPLRCRLERARHSSSIIKGLKCALVCLGVCDDFMAERFDRFRAEGREVIGKLLREIGDALCKLNL